MGKNISSELVINARNGDADAFCRLYDEIKDEMYRFALYTLGNASDADDVVSEAFIEAYRGIAKLREPAAFKSWIFRILRVRCGKKIAEYIGKRSVFSIEDFALSEGSDEKVESAAERKLLLLSALEKLSAEERMILMMSVLQGYTTLEISKIMRRPHGTVSSKLCRTYAKLKKELGGEFQAERRE